MKSNYDKTLGNRNCNECIIKKTDFEPRIRRYPWAPHCHRPPYWALNWSLTQSTPFKTHRDPPISTAEIQSLGRSLLASSPLSLSLFSSTTTLLSLSLSLLLQLLNAHRHHFHSNHLVVVLQLFTLATYIQAFTKQQQCYVRFRWPRYVFLFLIYSLLCFFHQCRFQLLAFYASQVGKDSVLLFVSTAKHNRYIVNFGLIGSSSFLFFKKTLGEKKFLFANSGTQKGWNLRDRWLTTACLIKLPCFASEYFDFEFWPFLQKVNMSSTFFSNTFHFYITLLII